MRGLAKNKPLIVAPRSARVLWRMTRYAPNLALNTITKTVQRRAGASPSSRAVQRAARRTGHRPPSRARSTPRSAAPKPDRPTATATTTPAAQADSVTAPANGASNPSSPSPITAPTRGHDTLRQITNLNAACPARNNAGPTRISPATQPVTGPAPGPARSNSRGPVRRRRHDDPGHHHRVDEVISRPAEPPWIRRVRDHLGRISRAPVEVQPPERDAGYHRDHERSDLSESQRSRTAQAVG